MPMRRERFHHANINKIKKKHMHFFDESNDDAHRRNDRIFRVFFSLFHFCIISNCDRHETVRFVLAENCLMNAPNTCHGIA